MRTIYGSSGRILHVSLSSRDVTGFMVPDEDRERYLGGKGLAIKALFDRLKPGIDPFDEDNVLVFMMGVLMGTGAPCSGRFAAATKSPLTGLVASSSCGGPFGMAFKTAGYEGLVITGKSDEPVTLRIDPDGVTFEPAADLWGKDTRETQETLELDRKSAAMVIGPAGENRVLYANIASGHRFFGRCGFGAVMGSKNLKAVVAAGGRYTIHPRDQRRFDEARKVATDYINRNRFTAELYRRYGTASNVNLCNGGGILPIRNFQDGTHPEAAAVSGQALRERYGFTYSTCKPCTILCGHKATINGREQQVPEYETVGLLGTNLGVFDPDRIAEWNDLCGRLGLDTISTGGTLAYVMEAGDKGLLETPLRFGTPDGVSEAIESIAYRRGFGDAMAQGTRSLAKHYGGEDFAIQVKGLEAAAYDPRGSWGQGLAYAVANRGACHLSATLFPLEVFFGFLDPTSTRAKARFTIFFEDLYAALNSLDTCLFTTYAYLLEPPVARFTPKPLLGFTMQALPQAALPLMDVSVLSDLFQSVMGLPMDQKRFLRAGRRIHTLERYLNAREGVSRKDDTLPQRFLRDARASDPARHRVPLERMLDEYYRLRGFTPNGEPTPKLLKRLGIMLPEGAFGRFVPDRKRFKTVTARVAFRVLGKALQSASRRDDVIRYEISRWPEGATVLFKVLPFGPRMGLEKEDGRLRYRGSKIEEDEADLVIYFKNLESAMLVLTPQRSIPQAFAEHRLSVKGDLSQAVALTRCINQVQALLYPNWIARRVMKRVPAVPFGTRQAQRLRLYALGIPFGL